MESRHLKTLAHLCYFLLKCGQALWNHKNSILKFSSAVFLIVQKEKQNVNYKNYWKNQQERKKLPAEENEASLVWKQNKVYQGNYEVEVGGSRKSEGMWGTDHQFQHAGRDQHRPLQCWSHWSHLHFPASSGWLCKTWIIPSSLRLTFYFHGARGGMQCLV